MVKKKRHSKVEKKSSRVAAQGLVGFKTVIAPPFTEINSKTDFVSKKMDFQSFIENILDIGISKKHSIDSLMKLN